MSKVLVIAAASMVSLAALEANERSGFYHTGRGFTVDLTSHVLSFKNGLDTAIAKAKPPQTEAEPKVAQAEPDFKVTDVQVLPVTKDDDGNFQLAGYNGNGNGYYRNGNGNGNGNGYYRNGNGNGNGNGYYRNGNGYRNGGYYRNGNGNGNGYYRNGNGNGYSYYRNGNGYNGNGNGYNGNGNGHRLPEVFVCHQEGYHSANGNGKRPVLVLQMVPPPHKG